MGSAARARTITILGGIKMTVINGKGVSIVPGDWEQEDNKMAIKVKYFNKEISRLEKIAKGDWIDLRCAEPGGVTIKAGGDAIIKLGVGMILPDGYEAHIAPRSSTFKKYGILLTNSVGVIDHSYNGDNDQWHFPAYCLESRTIVNGREGTLIQKGDRICQFRIVENQPSIEFIEVESLGNEDRGGFGSTGRN